MPAKRWTFATASKLVGWMEEEYLSEVVLEALEPPPGKPAKKVTFTWWLHGTGGPSKVPYHVEARGVTKWTRTGKSDGTAIGFLAARGEGVRLVMTTPGRLTLHCKELVVERGKPKRLPKPKKPFTDYDYFHVIGRGKPAPAAILRALGAPKNARLVTTAKFYRQVFVGKTAWVDLYDFGTEKSEYHWNVVRSGATDAAWRRAQELPHHLAAREVSSAWEFEGTPSEWLKTVGATRTRVLAR